MNTALLKDHVRRYIDKLKKHSDTAAKDLDERRERAAYYQSWTAQRLRNMTGDELSEYLAKLWAMRIWSNKQYAVDKLLHNHGIEKVRGELETLVWPDHPIEKRWDAFRKAIKGVGPAMMSEILCHTHPGECMLWNRRAYVGLHYLGVTDLPRYDYQMNGKKYKELCGVVAAIADEMRTMGDAQANMLTVDYFIWDELQVEENLSQIHRPQLPAVVQPSVEKADAATSTFIHDEVRDKLADIGRWLGFQADTEKKVAEGAVVDALWQATIGNMGRVIYVFEVQTKGSHDSLILNLLRSLNNPAVQGVVAVSDAAQLEKIKGEAAGVTNIKDKLKYWDYLQVLEVHGALESVNEAINNLGLVPQGF